MEQLYFDGDWSRRAMKNETFIVNYIVEKGVKNGLNKHQTAKYF